MVIKTVIYVNIINTITHADYVKFASQSKTEKHHHKNFALQVSTGLQYRMNAAVLKIWTSVSKTK